jgi:hypothetical protein
MKTERRDNQDGYLIYDQQFTNWKTPATYITPEASSDEGRSALESSRNLRDPSVAETTNERERFLREERSAHLRSEDAFQSQANNRGGSNNAMELIDDKFLLSKNESVGPLIGRTAIQPVKEADDTRFTQSSSMVSATDGHKQPNNEDQDCCHGYSIPNRSGSIKNRWWQRHFLRTWGKRNNEESDERDSDAEFIAEQARAAKRKWQKVPWRVWG